MLSQGSFLNLNLVWGLSWVPDITYPKKARAMFVPLTAGGKMLGSIKMGKQKRLESTSWNLVYCAAVFSNREKLNGSCFANGPYCTVFPSRLQLLAKRLLAPARQQIPATDSLRVPPRPLSGVAYGTGHVVKNRKALPGCCFFFVRMDAF